MLRIRTLQKTKPRERRIVPECLQPRAPHDHEIRDKSDQLATLSLVGYQLSAGTTYKLIVTSAHEDASSFELDLCTPTWIARQLDDRSIGQGKTRYVTFEANSEAVGLGKIHPLLQLTQLSTLSAKILFNDSREPFDLEIPIVIKRNVWLGVVSLFFPTIFGVARELFVNQSIPDWRDLVKFGLVGVLIWFVLFTVDNFRIWRQATKLKGLLDHPKEMPIVDSKNS